jgi:hypothetical protein
MRNSSFILTKRRILIALVLIWVIVVAACLLYPFGRPQPIDDVTARLGRAGRTINILIPAQAGHRAYMISVYNSGEVKYFTPEPQGVFTNAEMPLSATLTEWQAIDALRRQWCQARPQYPPANTGTLVYNVGWLCPGGVFANQIQIPISMAPPELTALIERLPRE